MRSYKIALALILLVGVPSLLLAAGPAGDGRFTKVIPGTEKSVPATAASLLDKVSFHIRFVASDGEHQLRVNVYDGSGREVLNAESTVVVKNGGSGRTVSYGFDVAHDSPGTWWYVAALDGTVMISNSIIVSQ